MTNNENNNENKFSYTYSAKEQAELKRIREKYISPSAEEDKMARLRRLDASVTETAQIVALVIGIVGIVFLGIGMSLILTELWEAFRISYAAATVVGIIIGILGGVLASLAYPAYNFVIREQRKKVAPEILRLTEELMK